MVLDGVKVVTELKRQRLTSFDLASKALCGMSTVQNDRSISTNSARRIASALGVPLENLLAEKEE